MTFLDVIDYLFVFVEKFFIFKNHLQKVFRMLNIQIKNSTTITQLVDLIVSNQIYKELSKLIYRFRFFLQIVSIYALLVFTFTKISRFFINAFESMLYLPVNIIIFSFKIISSLLYRIFSFILINPKYILLSSSILSLFIISMSIVCFANKVTDMKQTYDEKRAIAKLKLSTLFKIKIKILQLRKRVELKNRTH